ncbi:MAG TPA: hypothetical protein DGZ24_01175 [Rhodospirillaceae bacterium]|nr:hypothetical protein [Rhodospirillaceae bacterium]|tara:strand:- start:583 stop:1020 length:438 start_codon:yes stop_codon:yes gene_type:complete
MGNWNRPVGLNHVGAYQVSGQPWASGSINCKLETRHINDCVITFPYVTKWFKIINKDESNPCKVAFSLTGLTGSASNYFTVVSGSGSGSSAAPAYGDSGVIELKVTQLWISGSTNVDVVAGLTSIDGIRTQTPEGASWSGSSGVS